MGSLWLKVVAGLAGVLVLVLVAALMAFSMLPSPTTRELYKRLERWHGRRARGSRR